MLYFAYGSNMRRARLEQRVGPVQIVGVRPLMQYRHAFAKRGDDGSAKGAILADPDATTYGVVYQLSASQLVTLASFEGGYAQIEVSIAGEGMHTFEPHPGMIQRGLRPSEAYVAHYLWALREHAFPVAYASALRAEIQRLTGMREGAL